MDLRLYFEPVNFFGYHKGNKFGKSSLGYFIEKDQILADDLKKAAMAIVGVPDERRTLNKGTAKAPDEIRKYLYGLSNFDTGLKIVDLGNLKSGRTDQDIYFALRDVTGYLNDEGVVVVVLGGGQDLSIGIARAFHGTKRCTISVADPRVDIKASRQTSDASNFITRMLRDNPELFHLQLIGTQSHLAPPSVLSYLREQTFDYFQLGKIRDEFSSLEPALRNTDFLSFDISAIKHSDAPGHFQPSPNGFYAEEACKLARYAGLSNRLKAFGIFEVNPALDLSGVTANLAAQMVWYFAEALTHRKNLEPTTDKPAFRNYFVEMENHNEPMIFYCHAETNRWWIEIIQPEGDNWVLACTEKDYQQALKHEIPDIWWKYARKTEYFSK